MSRDDPRYSPLLADFSSVGGDVILTVCFLEKRVLLTMGFLRGWGRSKKPIKITSPLSTLAKIGSVPVNIRDVSWHCGSVSSQPGCSKKSLDKLILFWINCCIKYILPWWDSESYVQGYLLVISLKSTSGDFSGCWNGYNHKVFMALARRCFAVLHSASFFMTYFWFL